MLPKVLSFGDLSMKAAHDERYQRLAMTAARNLGYDPVDYRAAIRKLEELEEETDGDADMVGEVNYCRDLVK